MLTKELLQFPDAPSLLAQRCKLWRELPEHRHLRFVTVCGSRVVSVATTHTATTVYQPHFHILLHVNTDHAY